MNNNKIKHLEMIEAIIERMSRNCFQLKGWAMTIVTIVGALSANETDKRFLIIAFMPIIGFWLLDTIYLQQERKYRILYARVTQKEEKEIDFSLDTRSLDYSTEEKKSICLVLCFVSKSEILFYGILTATMIVLITVLKGWILFVK